MSTRIKVSMGVTINTGNFESVRVDVGVDDDLRVGETALDGYNRVSSFVEKALNDKMEEIRLEMSQVGR